MSLSVSDNETQSGSTLAIEQQEISQMVKCRMSSLGHPLDDYGKILRWLSLCKYYVHIHVIINLYEV